MIRAALQPLVNRSSAWQDWYERRLCRMFPANEIQYRISHVPAEPIARAA